MQKNELLSASQTSALEELAPPEKTKGKVSVFGFQVEPCAPLD